MTTFKSIMTKGTEFVFKMNELAIETAVKQATRQIIEEISHDILTESQKLVPVASGALKKSGHVEGPYVFSTYMYEDIVYDAGHAAYVEWGRRSTGQVQAAAIKSVKEGIYTKDQPWFRKAQSEYRKQLKAQGLSQNEIKMRMRQFSNTYSAFIPTLKIKQTVHQNFPPPGAIYQWLLRKGHSPEEARKMVYPISKHIVEKGIKARHYLLKAARIVMLRMKTKYSKDYQKLLRLRMMRGGVLQRDKV